MTVPQRSAGARPPERVVDKVIQLAGGSGCRVSRRGVVLFDPRGGEMWFGGHNRPPSGRACDASPACAASCAMRCVHAESMALRVVFAARYMAIVDMPPDPARGLPGGDVLDHLELVHAKAVDGQLVATGGPSCWQCSREVVDARIAAVWLYQVVSADAPPRWVRWTTGEFDAETRRACGVH